MFRNVIVLFATLLCSVQLFSLEKTVIDEGGVSGVWRKQDAPIYVRGNIVLHQQSQLIIEPGVEVIFEGAYSFEVYGSLIAVGAQNEPIVFRPFNPANRWLGIHLDTRSGQVASASRIEHCDFRFVANRPGNIRYGALRVSNHQLDSIVNNRFLSCEIGITLSARATTTKVADNVFDGIDGEWVVSLSTNQISDSFLFVNNQISRFRHKGLIVSRNIHQLKKLVIAHNVFSNDQLAAQFNFSNNALEILQNPLLGNIQINNNVFSNINKKTFNGQTIQIENNKAGMTVDFYGNQIENCGGREARAGGLFIKDSEQVSFERNRFLGNEGIMAGAAFLSTRRFFSEADTCIKNTAHYSETQNEVEFGKGGAYRVHIKGNEASILIGRGEFRENTSYSDGACFYFQIPNYAQLSGIALLENTFVENNTEFFGEGSVFAMDIDGMLDIIELKGNSFVNNVSYKRAAVYIVSGMLNPYGHVKTLKSDGNTLLLDPNLLGQSYIYYNGSKIPDKIIFSKDVLVAEKIAEFSDPDQQLIYFKSDGEMAANQNVDISIVNCSIEGINQGGYYFSTPGHIRLLDVNENKFSGIHSEFPAALQIFSGSFGTGRFNGNAYNNLRLISESNLGGVIHIESHQSIGSIRFENEQGTSIENQSGTADGGFVFISAKGRIDTISIKDSKYQEISGRSKGGLFHIASGVIGEFFAEGSLFSKIRSSGSGGAFSIRADRLNGFQVKGGAQKNEKRDFDDVSAGKSGGVFHLDLKNHLGVLKIENTTFTNCYAGDHGGVIGVSMAETQTQPISVLIEGVSYHSNDASVKTGGSGGFLFFDADAIIQRFEVKSSWFDGMLTEGDGGVFYFRNKAFGLIELTESHFQNIRAEGSGGVLFAESDYMDIIRIQDVWDQSASAATEPVRGFSNIHSNGHGGVIHAYVKNNIGGMSIKQLLFREISSKGNGGALNIIIENKDNPNQGMTIDFQKIAATEISAGGAFGGGFMRFDAQAMLKTISVAFSHFRDINAKGPGGVFQLHAAAGAESIEFNENTFIGIQSEAQGGILSMEAGNLSSLTITGQFDPEVTSDSPVEFQNVSSLKDGSLFHIITSQSPGMISLHNLRIKDFGSLEGHGGFYFISESEQPPFGGSSVIMNNLLVSGGSHQSESADQGLFLWSGNSSLSLLEVVGVEVEHIQLLRGHGFMSFRDHGFNKVLLENITASNIQQKSGQDASGGVLHLHSETNLVISLDVFESRFSDIGVNGNGGVISVYSPPGILGARIENNTFENIFSGGRGGALFLSKEADGSKILGGIRLVGNSFRNTNVDVSLPVPEMGGAVYLNNIENIHFENNKFESLTCLSKGGAVFARGMHFTHFNDSLYSHNKSKGEGGALYIEGIGGRTEITLNALDFIRNTAAFGSAIYAKDARSLNLSGFNRNYDTQTRFISNLADSTATVYIQGIDTVEVCGVGFLGNMARHNAGGLYVSKAGLIRLANNQFIGNSAAYKGGALHIRETANGTLTDNLFQFNDSSKPERGGAIYIERGILSQGRINLSDNIFYENSGYHGGAVWSDQAIGLYRNIFRSNSVRSFFNDHFGPALYLESHGVRSVFYNNVFDQNISDSNQDGSVYLYVNIAEPNLPEYTFENNLFLSTGQNNAVFVKDVRGGLIHPVQVVNSVFVNYSKSNHSKGSDLFAYFNEHVKASYSNLAFAGNYQDNNFDAPLIFDPLKYTTTGDLLTDRGNPDGRFNDNHFPPAKGLLLNDVGITGGPHNPQAEANVLREYADTVGIQIRHTRDCSRYLFESVPENGQWDSYQWILPDQRFLTINNDPVLAVEMDLEPGQYVVKLMTEKSVGGKKAYGFSRRTFSILKPEIRGLLPDQTAYDLVSVQPDTTKVIVRQHQLINNQLVIKPELYNVSNNAAFHWSIVSEDGLGIRLLSAETGVREARLQLHDFGQSAIAGFTLKLTIDDCYQVSHFLKVEVVIPLGLSQSERPFKVYPNPARNAVNIQNPYPESFYLQIYSHQGIKTMGQTIDGNEQIILNIENLTPGVYFIRIHDKNKGVYTAGKFIKLSD